MFEVITETITDGAKRGPELPFVGPKLILECTNTQTGTQALWGYERDYKSHRPHYVIDQNESKIHKILNTDYGVIGDFHPSQPQWASRCVFVAMVKEEVISLSAEQEKSVGRLLRILCDIEAVPAITHEGGRMGTATFTAFEGIVCWYSMPDGLSLPGKINWSNLNKGLQDYKTPDLLGIAGEDTKIYEDEDEAAVEIPTEDLGTLTMAELKEIASEAGVAYRNLRKAELIEAIEAARA
ncbi:MAG: hypothetical protein HOI21_00295 [Bacteroidetes Order II. Incertae sedis bacterium]|jgi:hypothetical protein|nr:hypothetical protein [Bacteroidetes Order II. bacterium]